MLSWLKAKLQIAHELSPTDWLRLGEAWLTLLWFYVAVRTTSFEKLNISVAIKPNAVKTSEFDFALDLHRLVHLASRLHLLSMTCLPRSFTLSRMLNRRGIPTQVQIGATKTVQGIQAHAWLEVNGQQVGEPEDVPERFQKFDLGGR